MKLLVVVIGTAWLQMANPFLSLSMSISSCCEDNTVDSSKVYSPTSSSYDVTYLPKLPIYSYLEITFLFTFN